MDQHIPERSSAKYRSVLLEMRRDARPGLDMLYLSGLAETLALIDRQNAQKPGSHDLNVRAIACVLRAWGDFEGDTWAGGFVLELFDGRRMYVESRADGPGSVWLLYQSKRCSRIATCRNFLRTTMWSCTVGAKAALSWATT